jgi:hypothetical protein
MRLKMIKALKARDWLHKTSQDFTSHSLGCLDVPIWTVLVLLQCSWVPRLMDVLSQRPVTVGKETRENVLVWITCAWQAGQSLQDGDRSWSKMLQHSPTWTCQWSSMKLNEIQENANQCGLRSEQRWLSATRLAIGRAYIFRLQVKPWADMRLNCRSC